VIYGPGDHVEIKRERTIIDSVSGMKKSIDTISGVIVYGSVSSCYIMDRPYRVEDVSTYTVVVDGKKRVVNEDQIIRKIEVDQDDKSG